MDIVLDQVPFGAPVLAFFPDIDCWRLVARYGLPTGGDLWSGDMGIVLTPRGPTRFRYVHPAPRALQ